MWLRENLEFRDNEIGNKRRSEEAQDLLTTAFVRTSETLTEDMLLEYGGKIYAQLGDVSIITIPMSQIGKLIEIPSVLRVEANKRADVMLDTVPLVSNILPIYENTPEHSAFTGSGVVVGLVDVGFDLTHPTFYNNVSRSEYRIKAFWDQLAKRDETSTEKFPVGREFVTESDILVQGCATDGKVQTHGTHTAGIAVGSGFDLPYRGIAYESDICLVANAVTSDTAFIDAQDYYLYTSATDALGFKYIFDYAEQQGKPCVVSFSEGYTPYMDDDDLLYNNFLERLTGPGRIFLASAGNESRALTYIDKPIGKEQAGAFLKTGGEYPLYRIKSNEPPTLTFYAYAEGNTPTHQLEIAANDERWAGVLIDTLFIDNDTLAIVINNYPSAFDQQGTFYMVQLHGNKAINQMSPIAIVIGGKEQQVSVIGSSSNALANLDTDSRWNDAIVSHNTLGPGCLKAPITVGSITHRQGFRNIEGKWVDSVYSNEESGLWSPFSSVGPTLDERIKPDICAPGRNVISSYSSYYREEHPTATNNDVANTEVDGRIYPWHADSGTSMSCPVAAGIIALWLQAKPDLTRNDIMGILERTSRHPEEALTYPNNKYGYGEIDVYRGLLYILGIDGVPAISQQHTKARVFSSGKQVRIVLPELLSAPLNICIYNMSGHLVKATALDAGQTDYAVPVSSLPSGIYAVQINGSSKYDGSTLIKL